jgi:hypothetical protein
VEALIDRLADGSRDDAARDRLLTEVARLQASRVSPYARLVASRLGDDRRIESVEEIPALPTDVFRFARVASFGEEETTRTFLTSGTTHGERGAHPFRDLALYDRAARSAASHALFAGIDRARLVFVAAHPDEAPDSSLSYMLGRFDKWFGDGASTWIAKGSQLDVEALTAALRAAEETDNAIVILGTSFAFVHLEDALGTASFSLPAGSRIMQTGGFKGRTREIAPSEMRRILGKRYGVAETHIVGEYGMTELSSQMYETTLVAPYGPRRYWVPGWMRAIPVDAESLAPVPEGEVGILRIDDLANLESVCALQTADLARTVGDGIEILGRASGAVPRGCSLAMDAALSGVTS